MGSFATHSAKDLRAYAGPVQPPTSVAQLLTLLTTEPGRPRLTWYGGGGERIELSGAVLANWVAKTTNLLVEEFDAGPDVRIGLDLPAHWRTVVWALAAWRCGACVVVGDGVGGADVVVTDGPSRWTGAGEVIAVALPALARRFDGELPAGAIDAAQAVMTYGDAVGWAPSVDLAAPALDSGDPDDAVHYGALIAWAAGTRAGSGATEAPAGTRVLLGAGPGRSDDLVAMLRRTLDLLARAGSVVLLDASKVAELASDPARHERLIASERVTG